MSPRSSRGSNGRLRIYLLVAVLAVTAPLMVAVATDAFSTATLSRDASADVVADSEGPLGINVSQPATGTTSEYLGLTNQFGEEVSVTVTLADGSQGDLVVGGQTAGDTATFSLAAGAREAVELSVPCEESLEGQAVAATIEVSGSGVSGTFERSATIESGCSPNTGPQHESINSTGGVVETGNSTASIYLEAKDGYRLTTHQAYYKVNGEGFDQFLGLSDDNSDGRYNGTISGISPGDNITYYFVYGDQSGGSTESQTYTYIFQGDGGGGGEPTPTPTPTPTTTTTPDPGDGDRHVTSEYITGINETDGSTGLFYLESNNGEPIYSVRGRYRINDGSERSLDMNEVENNKRYEGSLSGLSPGDTITYYFNYDADSGTKTTETYTYTFGESQTTTTTSTTTTTTQTTTTTTSTETGQRHETAEYIAGLNESNSTSVLFYLEPNNNNSFSYGAVTYSINGGTNTTKEMNYLPGEDRFEYTLSGLSPGDTITYSFQYGNSYTETWTYTFQG